MRVLALVVAAYLLGSLPTSFLLARHIKGIDLTSWGSGNLGATNLYRAAGSGLASLAVLIDLGKGFIPTRVFAEFDGVEAPELALAYGAGAMLGHIFSLWVGFRGGKGVATGGGVYFALAPAATAMAAGVWLVTAFATRIVSLGSLLAGTLLPVLAWFTGHQLDYVFWSTLPVGALVWWTHRGNLRRLLAGEELAARRGVGAPEREDG